MRNNPIPHRIVQQFKQHDGFTSRMVTDAFGIPIGTATGSLCRLIAIGAVEVSGTRERGARVYRVVQGADHIMAEYWERLKASREALRHRRRPIPEGNLLLKRFDALLAKARRGK
ncbi:hypothetical protein FE392_10935 [Xenorhabdus sp. 12]|uniref:Uncharacterized protein n=1 Tax=Xenorhabdus santafensis TaxID=2582833 RepID=A0ABU4SAR6_9GAMM|nr:hypothetical protein [Xenorhabdus sp. 12]MDX7987841.1 hypothetical protein [Xenorhabdus sp. 12]